MALKYNNNDVKVVKFNNNNVNKVIKDGTVVWLRQYTITWKNYDGSVLKTDSVSYGTTPNYTGTLPTRPADTNYNYTFKGWSPSVSAVTGDKTYTATYSSSTRSYTITFKDSNAAYWSSPAQTAYPGDVLNKTTSTSSAFLTCSYLDSNSNLAQRWKVSVLTKRATAQYTYKLNNWDFLLPSTTVTGNMTVNAPSGSVTTNKYTVKIVATTGVSSTFISTKSTATSGTDTTSGASMAYSTTTYYGFVKVANSTVLQNTMPTTWERIGINGSYTIYKVWSGQITGAINYNPGTMTPITGTVTVSKADYMYGIYLSTSATAAPGSGSASGSAFKVGTTVYAIAMFTGTQYSAISSMPKTWGSVNYNGTYYYCSVGSTTVTTGANTITYSAPTLKSKLPAPSASIRISGGNYIAEIHNNTNVTTTVTVTWYNASTNAYLGSATVTPGSYGTATTVLALTKASSVYVKATAAASGYLNSDTTKSQPCSSQPKLSAPVLGGDKVSTSTSGYKYSLTIKNNNSVAVTCHPEYGNNITIAANSSGTVTFTSSSSYEYVRCYFSASGYQDSDIEDFYVEYTPPSTGGTTR